MTPHPTPRLTADQAAAVRGLADQAHRVDGVAPLSEQTLLHLDAPPADHRHVLVHDGDDLVGYAHLDHTGAQPGVELVTTPARRRSGIATSMWAAVTGLAPDARAWAHGDLPAAQAASARAGLVVVRSLWQMARPADGLQDVEITLPPGYTWRSFEPADVDAWVALNGRAFATHPEQGRVTADDVRARMAEDWFDPEGFFLVHGPAQAPGRQGALVAFHWTKIEQGEGEVYVVGVDPGHQGLGLGRASTLLGLRHLARRGVPRITLYVDGDNVAALATYRALGFETSAVDVMYGRD